MRPQLLRNDITAMTGDPRRDALVLRDFARNTIGSLWDAPPKINPYTDRPYRGVLLEAPRVTHVLLGAGGTVLVEVGAGGGGFGQRRFVVDPGAVAFLALGEYGSARILLETIGDGSAPVTMQWTDSDTLAAAGIRLRAPLIDSGAAPLPETEVPNGAFEVFNSAAVTYTWRSYALGGGLFTATPQVMVAGTMTRVLGSTIQTNAATQLQFFLAPL